MSRFSQKKREIIERMARESLLEAANNIVQQKGWEALTVEQLAREAGMAKGSVYNYFRNKNDIVDFLIHRILEPMEREFLAIDCDSGDPRELFEKMLDIQISFLFEDPLIMNTFAEAAARGYDTEALGEASKSVMRGRIIRVFERGVREGVFKDHQPTFVVEFITCVMSGLGVRSDLPDLKTGFGAFIKEVILNGIAQPVKSGEAESE